MSFWHDLPRPFFVLAPMEAVTDVVFRHVVAKAGAPDLFFTEFTNATGWAHAGDKAIGMRLIKTDDEEPIVAQIWGAVPDDIAKLATHCKTLGFHGIDINMGCPDASAIKAGGGAAMIRTPELASEVIAAAKTAGLPVSVKTRLGYTSTDEWRSWLTHLLQQDIVNLTIHLRTKKEMSKVPAHFELIPEIITLRDEIAPGTLLTINGDIENRAEGLELAAKYPGIDGIMIGRGVFHDPFCFVPSKFALSSTEFSKTASRPTSIEPSSVSDGAADVLENSLTSGSTSINVQARVTSGGAAPAFEEVSDSSKEGADQAAGPETVTYVASTPQASAGNDGNGIEQTRLIELLHYHLDLHDQWDTPEHPRKFDPLKRFFKVYVHSFDGAAELRDKLMHTKNTAEVRAVLRDWSQKA